MGNYEVLIAPHQVAIDITNKCNFRCLHCYNHSGDNFQVKDELSDSDVLNFIDDICKVGVLNVCFCGGEPLLRKKLILECIKRLRKSGIPNVAMVTNGMLLTEKVAFDLKKAGITTIQLSIDGACEKSHDRLRNYSGAFEGVKRAIEVLKKVGIEPNFAFTPTSFNVEEIKEVHSLLRSYGLYNVNFRTQPLMLMGRATENLLDIKPSQEQYRKFVRTINEINKSGELPNIEWGDPVDHLIRFSERKIILNQTTIRANGDIVASTYLPFVVGNIRRHSLIEYWDAGLAKIWTYDITREIAKTIKCIDDMNKTQEHLPKVWQEKDIEIDLIEEDLNNLDLLYKRVNYQISL